MRQLQERVDQLERRESSYTDQLIAALQAQATGESKAFPTATAALEACSGIVGRAFATAIVDSSDAVRMALTPARLMMIGRALISPGEIIFQIDTDGGVLDLIPATDTQVTGTHRRESWQYKMTLPGPSEMASVASASGEGVVHIMYAVESSKPWKGVGPVGVATLAGKLSAETVNQLANESAGPVTNLLPVPVDGMDATVDELKQDIRKANGEATVVESGDWDNPGGGRDAAWRLARLGANPPASLVNLHEVASREIYAACGVPPGLFASGGQSSANRESYRQLLHSTIAPLARLVSSELTEKLETDVSLDFAELKAGDVATAARAFKGFVDAGMEIDRALALSGLLTVTD